MFDIADLLSGSQYKTNLLSNSNIAEDYAKFISNLIPIYLSEGEREFVSSRFYPLCSFPWLFMKDGYLIFRVIQYPNKPE
jgi:hypothetical protein